MAVYPDTWLEQKRRVNLLVQINLHCVGPTIIAGPTLFFNFDEEIIPCYESRENLP